MKPSKVGSGKRNKIEMVIGWKLKNYFTGTLSDDRKNITNGIR